MSHTISQVACTEREFEMNELKVQPHRPMLEAMAASTFCLILPGNSQSSQRITEAFLTGCIPVFLGPPWHTLPFSHEVRVWQMPCCMTYITREGLHMHVCSAPSNYGAWLHLCMYSWMLEPERAPLAVCSLHVSVVSLALVHTATSHAS